MSFIPGGIGVVLVDDNRMFIHALEPLLNGVDGVSVLALGTSGDDAVLLSRVYQPHVLLIEVGVGGPPIALTIAMVHQYSPSTRVLVMATNAATDVVLDLVDKEAWGYISKASPLSELIESIRSAPYQGWRGMPRARQLPVSVTAHARGGIVSRRELEVVELIAAGSSNAAIARHLTISAGTVKRHVANLYAKLGVNSRVEAFRRGVSLGLLPPPENAPLSSVEPLLFAKPLL